MLKMPFWIKLAPLQNNKIAHAFCCRTLPLLQGNDLDNLCILPPILTAFPYIFEFDIFSLDFWNFDIFLQKCYGESFEQPHQRENSEKRLFFKCGSPHNVNNRLHYCAFTVHAFEWRIFHRKSDYTWKILDLSSYRYYDSLLSPKTTSSPPETTSRPVTTPIFFNFVPWITW